MADEAVAASAAAAAAPPIVIINYGIHELTSVEVIREINECVSHNQHIELLTLEFPARNHLIHEGAVDENYERFRFDATVDMQDTIVRNSRPIKEIVVWNDCSEKEEHRRCFNYFTNIVRLIRGNGKHLTYYNNGEEKMDALLFERAIQQLAEAVVQSRNNKDTTNAIESFHFGDPNLTPGTFQLLWNTLLDSGTRKITFYNTIRNIIWNDTADVNHPINDNNNNNTINFTGMETNASLKELDLAGYDMGEEDFRSLFHSMKWNKGLVTLKLKYSDYQELPKEVKKLLEEVLCENSTLLDCCLKRGYHDVHDRIFEVIHCQMEVNRRWKRYLLKREREKIVRTVLARTKERENTNNNHNEEDERKKRLKMRLLFRVFHQKPVLRTTLLFHLLSEYPDDLVDTEHFRNR